MTTLKTLMTMLKNRSNTVGTAFGVFAICITLAVVCPLQAHAADGDTVSFLNFYTGAALGNGGINVNGTQLITSIWFGVPNLTQQQWQILPGSTSLADTTKKISSLNNFKLADVLGHCALPLFPVVQAQEIRMDNTLSGCNGQQTTFAFFFQRWEFIRFAATRYFIVKNKGTSMCLADYGAIGTGGAVVEQACDFNPRQLWAIWDFNFGIWE